MRKALLGIGLVAIAGLVLWFLRVIENAGNRHVEGIGERPPPEFGAQHPRAEPVATPRPKPPQPPPKHDILSAWVISKEFVKERLSSPSTADFGSLLGETQSADKQCADHGDGIYSCRGWVDAQNKFGATVRADWAVTVKYLGNEEWRAVTGPLLTER